jgi:Transcriptional regulator, AbiEi antitoxin
MGISLPPDCQELLSRQSGVISREQAVHGGIAVAAIRNQLRSGRWQRLQAGVYAIFTGVPSRDAELWAVVLRAGSGAALSHETAAELHGMASYRGQATHVTVPATRHPVPIRGAVIHLSGRLDQARHPVMLPPRTRVEDTVIDLTQAAASFDDAFGWLCCGVGRRLTTAARLQAALDARPKVRWRAGLTAVLSDIGSGVTSGLEYRYVTGVERAHGMPPARRQAKVVLGLRIRYVDNLYEDAGLAVELDGQAAHSIEDRWSDMHRDNAHATAGLITLRYNWADVTLRPCQVAGQVADVLRQRGRPVRVRRCGPGCAVNVTRSA